MKILIMSDIHGNEQALKAVLDKVETEYKVDGCFLLGDIIDYGMHSNEVISMLYQLSFPVFCNICGNHEDAVLHDNYERFSSKRGEESARYTKSVLNPDSWDYIHNEMKECGFYEFECDGKMCLAVHGSLEDKYWKSIKPEEALQEYREYDYVFSGHSHQPHFIEKYYEAEDAERRNKKKVVFINPGSVGQPRNHNPQAKFVILNMDTEQVFFDKVSYNIKKEQEAYCGQVDEFYCERLKWGI